MLRVGEFLVPAVVAALVDEFPGGGEIVLRRFPRVRVLAEEEAGAVQVDVGQVQPHGAAFGNVPRFIQVGPRTAGVAIKRKKPGASQHAANYFVLHSCPPQRPHSSFAIVGRYAQIQFGSLAVLTQSCSGENQMAETDVYCPSARQTLHDDRLCPSSSFSTLFLIKQEVAVAQSLNRGKKTESMRLCDGLGTDEIFQRRSDVSGVVKDSRTPRKGHFSLPMGGAHFRKMDGLVSGLTGDLNVAQQQVEDG